MNKAHNNIDWSSLYEIGKIIRLDFGDCIKIQTLRYFIAGSGTECQVWSLAYFFTENVCSLKYLIFQT